jgi:hypothetical protein
VVDLLDVRGIHHAIVVRIRKRHAGIAEVVFERVLFELGLIGFARK